MILRERLVGVRLCEKAELEVVEAADATASLVAKVQISAVRELQGGEEKARDLKRLATLNDGGKAARLDVARGERPPVLLHRVRIGALSISVHFASEDVLAALRERRRVRLDSVDDAVAASLDVERGVRFLRGEERSDALIPCLNRESESER